MTAHCDLILNSGPHDCELSVFTAELSCYTMTLVRVPAGYLHISDTELARYLSY